MKLSLLSPLIRSTGLGPLRRVLSSASDKPLFNKILIANRGEIACRIIRTARKLGIQTVAVYSDADRHAEHVKAADEAVYIGPSPASESYLRGDKIVQACLSTGAQAVHPGYGFLSENLPFCEQITKANLVFIGPPPNAIRSMGSKSESKDIMIKASVPVTPGYHGIDNSNETLLQKAREIGWPLMIKAVSGGGGKGMRAVFEESKFIESLESCRREAIKSFNDGQVLLEKLIQAPRHVELQVFGDMLGNAVHLAERDCSVQRRHQKVLEEAPAPNLHPSVRKAMGDAAVACVRAVGYVGAGTVEFLVDSVTQDFYFCEMNTRLQVEHPVTELITGTDLVEWQLRVASGQPIPLSQQQINERVRGCAVEARIYAENPLRDFLPASGHLSHLRTPVDVQNAEEGIRVDSGVIAGNDVSTFYDPMIAKLIAHAETRDEALKKLERGLRRYQVAGLPNNIDFLVKVVRHSGFTQQQATTAFFSQHMDGILASLAPVPLTTLPVHSLFGLVCYLQSLRQESDGGVWDGEGEFSFWRNNPRKVRKTLNLQNGKDSVEVISEVRGPHSFHFSHDQSSSEGDKKQLLQKNASLKKWNLVREDVSERHLHCAVVEAVLEVDNISVVGTSAISTAVDGSIGVDVWLDGQVGDAPTHYHFQIQNPAEGTHTASVSANPVLLSPMPGKVVKVLVADGQEAKQGEPLIILEAMKMEHVVHAPSTGKVQVFCSEGDTVSEGTKLAEVAQA
eukprot:scaffold3867_cov150-Ochromonas_danica.AAC.7